MNDRDEYVRAVREAKRWVRWDLAQLDMYSARHGERIAQTLAEEVPEPIYVCSLCGDGNSPHMWQQYARNSTGYAIGFDAAAIAELAAEQHFTLDACVYAVGRYAGRAFLEPLIRDISLAVDRIARQHVDGVCPRDYPAAAIADQEDALRAELYRLAPLFKGYDWEPENESRLVLRSPVPPGLAVHPRPGGGDRGQYVEFRLTAGTRRPPITSITLGPQAADKAAAARDVRTLVSRVAPAASISIEQA